MGECDQMITQRRGGAWIGRPVRSCDSLRGGNRGPSGRLAREARCAGRDRRELSVDCLRAGRSSRSGRLSVEARRRGPTIYVRSARRGAVNVSMFACMSKPGVPAPGVVRSRSEGGGCHGARHMGRAGFRGGPRQGDGVRRAVSHSPHPLGGAGHRLFLPFRVGAPLRGRVLSSVPTRGGIGSSLCSRFPCRGGMRRKGRPVSPAGREAGLAGSSVPSGADQNYADSTVVLDKKRLRPRRENQPRGEAFRVI